MDFHLERVSKDDHWEKQRYGRAQTAGILYSMQEPGCGKVIDSGSTVTGSRAVYRPIIKAVRKDTANS